MLFDSASISPPVQAQSAVHDAVKSIDILDPSSEVNRFEEKVRREEARIEGQGDARISERTGKVSESWRGNERRYGDDASYTGPERRLAVS
mgnify:CR=1 FL=1